MYKGYRWVMGDGESIIATKDPWIRSKDDFHVENSHMYEGRNEQVSHWFVPGMKQWDADRVHAHFQEADAKAILAIFVPQREASDRVAWVGAVDGKYTVKAGYKYWHKQNIEITNVVHGEG